MDPVIIALGIGAAILLFAGKKKKNGTTPPPSNGDEVPGGGDQPSGGGDQPSGGGDQPSGGAKRSPKTPFPGQNSSKENGAVSGFHTAWLSALTSAMVESGNAGAGAEPTVEDVKRARELYGVDSGRSVASWLADEAFYTIYPGVGRIPNESQRGPGWDGYINAAKRMYSYAKSLRWTTIPGTGA